MSAFRVSHLPDGSQQSQVFTFEKFSRHSTKQQHCKIVNKADLDTQMASVENQFLEKQAPDAARRRKAQICSFVCPAQHRVSRQITRELLEVPPTDILQLPKPELRVRRLVARVAFAVDEVVPLVPSDGDSTRLYWRASESF